jgi:hypothetical protein
LWAWRQLVGTNVCVVVHFLEGSREQSARCGNCAPPSLAGDRDQDKRPESRELIAAIYDRFTESLDTADLQDVKVLPEGRR